MSPPAAVFQESFSHTTPIVAKKVQDDSTTILGGNMSKGIEEMLGNWDNFKFAPIRESQVSRAMTRRYFDDLNEYVSGYGNGNTLWHSC